MDRQTVVVVAVVVAAIVAVGLSAATLTSTVESGDRSGDGGPGGDGQFGLNVTDSDEDDTDEFSLLDALPHWLVLVALTALIAIVVSVAPRQVAMAVVMAVMIFGGVLLLMVLDIDLLFEGDLSPFEGDEGGEGPGTEEDGLQSPLIIGLLGLGLVAVLALVFLLCLREGDAVVPGTDEDTGTEDDTAALGTIAGRAADRIEAGESGDAATNEVYRAWQEMTGQLDLEKPDTATPREFQARAVAAGMSAGDVRELTRLFEQVRYGGESATADREKRALQVLRRIEATYGEGP